jgi:hypothetical protein
VEIRPSSVVSSSAPAVVDQQLGSPLCLGTQLRLLLLRVLSLQHAQKLVELFGLDGDAETQLLPARQLMVGGVRQWVGVKWGGIAVQENECMFACERCGGAV